MTADEIYGKRGFKSQQHAIDYQWGRPWIKSDDEGEPREKLEERHDDGNQVDEHSGEKVIPVNNFCKNSRRQNLVITGIYKGYTKNPACRQLDPVVTKEGFDEFIQWDALLLPIPESRR